MIDPQLLFQRLTAILLNNKNCDITFSDLAKYSLSPYPADLFETIDVMLPSDKPKLLEKLLPLSSADFRNSQHGSAFVIDGGYVIHKKVFWQYNSTFGDIALRTAKSLKSQYGPNAVVVFDGYPEHPTTKDHTHQVR